jgi:phytol kinase
MVFWGYFLTYAYVFFLIGLSTLLKYAFHAKGETTRKVVHIGCCFAWFIMAWFFGPSWHLLIPPLTFIVLNFISYKKGTFSAMERSDNPSPGTVYYPVSMTVMSAFTVFADRRFLLLYGIALLSLSLGDGFAPIFGSIRKGNKPLYGGKSLYGTLSVFVFSMLTSVLLLLFPFPEPFYTPSLPMILIASFVGATASALLELFSKKGLDNIFMPLGMSAALYLILLLA